MKILIEIFFSHSKKIVEHDVALVKDQCILDIRKYSYIKKLLDSISQWLPCPLAISAIEPWWQSC